MPKEKLHTAEEIHSAMDKIGGFTYQFYCFLLHLLKMKRGETVSFEKLDDAAKESENLITLYQTKHSVQVDVNGETMAFSDRSKDLWKAIDVWRKLIIGNPKRSIEEQKKFIEEHEFHFVSNKPLTNNILLRLCKNAEDGAGNETIDVMLEKITQEGKSRKEGKEESKCRTVQMMIDDLRNFELREKFLKKIKFETKIQGDIQKECIQHIADGIRFSDEEAKNVFDDFFTEAVKDFFEYADKGIPLSYTFEEQKKRFERVFQYHREEKLDFRIVMQPYKKDFIDLVCIQQLIKVKDFNTSDTAQIAMYASHFYSFKNRYDQLHEDSKILEKEDNEFRSDAITFWNNEFRNAYDDMDETATDEDIVKKAKKILYEVRKHNLKLRNEDLGITISNGAYYYLSDECIIGWHRDWKEFFKSTTEQYGQNH